MSKLKKRKSDGALTYEGPRGNRLGKVIEELSLTGLSQDVALSGLIYESLAHADFVIVDQLG